MANVVRLGKKPNLNFYEIAVGIYELHELNPHLLSSLPGKSGMSRRRIYYLLDAGNLIRAQEVSKSDAETIGWTKLQIVTRYILSKGGVTGDELNTYLETAKNVKARDLKKALSGRIIAETLAVVFYLTKEEQALVNEALVDFDAGVTGQGLVGKEAAFMKIIKLALNQA